MDHKVCHDGTAAITEGKERSVPWLLSLPVVRLTTHKLMLKVWIKKESNKKTKKNK